MDATASYGMTKEVDLSFPEAVEKIKTLLGEEGFGVLTTIDVQATMKAKLGVEEPPYVILGACNPHIAHEALGLERAIGLLLPCNVVVYERDGRTTVAIQDPEVTLGVAGNPALAGLGAKARDLLEKAIAGL